MNLYEDVSKVKIEYSDNTGYRKCLRKFFQMNPSNYKKLNELKSLEDLDEETEDEISYDEEAATTIMDIIYDKTKESPLFQTIYEIAAGKMLSQDKTIGLAVVLSYDYFKYFHVCLVDYLYDSVKEKDSTSDFNEENNNYITLLKKIS
jgi:hypothetical protein